MAKDKLTDYDSTTASNNTDIGGVSIAEGMLPSNVNNSMRELTKQLGAFADGTDGVDVLKLQDDTDTNSIKLQAPASVTATTTFTLPDGDGSADQVLKTDGSGQLGFADRHPNPSLIINGAATVNQRGDSTGVTSTGYYGPDRFQLLYTDAGTWSISQSSTVPEGFANSYKLDCTTAKASLAANSRLFVQTKLEGQNLQHLKKGTSNAVSTTLSFWVRSNKTGTYQVNIEDNDNIRIIGSTYAISSADTWEYKEVTFAGDTSGVLGDDNGDSLVLMWALVAGTDNSSGAVPTAWEAKSNTDRGAGLTVNLADSTSNEWYITGVKLEVGETATPFVHRSYGEELALCQRYYYNTYITPQASGSATDGIIAGTFNAGDRYAVRYIFPTTMRADPSVVFYGGRSTVADTADRVAVYNSDNLRSFASEPSSRKQGVYGFFDTNSTEDALRFHFTANAEL